uniref:Uncharacterized protein n=1 Tax=Lepeophtheirus salmonis TaxID=72036 RepID=A0A0K2T814_LEPSM
MKRPNTSEVTLRLTTSTLPDGNEQGFKGCNCTDSKQISSSAKKGTLL